LYEVVNAIRYAGGKCVFVDLDERTGLPNEDLIDKKISDNTAAILITHLFSKEKDLLRFEKKYSGKIKIIEDTAINFGAKLSDGRNLGTIFDYGFYSFGLMKVLTTYHGGALYIRDNYEYKNFYNNNNQTIPYPKKKIISLYFFSILINFFYNKYIFKYFTYYFIWYFTKNKIKFFEKIISPGLNPKISNIVPEYFKYEFCKNFNLIGLENIDDVTTQLNSRREIVGFYEKYINKKLLITNFDFYDVNAFLEFPILLKKNTSKFISEKLLNEGYDVRHTFYPNISKYFDNFDNEKYPICERFENYILSLPTNSNFDQKDCKKICEIINQFEN
jgi:dTDP-4-amino-4,6-dideoxygalactose transaminase